jgi:hypothetical protein
MILTNSVDRKVVEVLREKLKDEKDPLTRKILELKIAKKEARQTIESYSGVSKQDKLHAR